MTRKDWWKEHAAWRNISRSIRVLTKTEDVKLWKGYLDYSQLTLEVYYRIWEMTSVAMTKKVQWNGSLLIALAFSTLRGPRLL